MSLWRQLTRGLRVLTNRAAADRDVAEEVQHYFDEATAALSARGLSPEAAHRAAILEIGNAAVVREQVRAYGWENTIGTLAADLRYAARRLRRSPGFAVVSVVTLSLGIGASTAIFSAVNPILFEPLPYPHAERIVTIWDHAVDSSRLEVTFGTYRELAERARSFDALAVMKPWQPTMTGALEPERFDGQRVSAGYFRSLGVSPAIGADFDASDDRANGANVAILGDALWRRLGGDPALIGRTVMLDDRLYTVVGVMPSTFENVLSPAAQLWTLMQYDLSLPPQGREWGHHLRMVGRLAPGVAWDRATGDLDVIARTPVPAFSRAPWAALKQGLVAGRLQDDVTRAVKPALTAVIGAVVLVLAIACVNVTNLLLAREAQRRGEFAMRAALGAGRGRIIRQLLTESLLLALIGGALGMAIAAVGVRALVALSPPGLPRVDAIRIDAAVFAFGVGITTLLGLCVGMLPALHASRDLRSEIHHSSRHTAGGHQLTRRTLVVAEVALALVLLVSAGLLLRSLQRLFAVAPGFDASHVITMQVQATGRRFGDAPSVRRFFARTLESVRQVPGVASAAFTSQLPLSGDFESYGVQFASSPTYSEREDRSAVRYAVTPAYFEAMRIPVRSGRLLDARDTAAAPLAAVINESFAKRRFPDGNAIGQRAHLGGIQPWYTVVGVVADVKHTSLAATQVDEIYTTTEQWDRADNPLSLVVRARGDAGALATALRQAIWSVDKDQPVARVVTMDALLARSAAERRFALILFEAFAVAALALAAIGIYGVLAGGVAERTREIGVRTALGASRAQILAMVVRQGMSLTGVGVAIGLAGAAAASGAIGTLLFGISPLDPVTYIGVVGLLAAVATIACWIPAARAARVDPAITLRSE